MANCKPGDLAILIRDECPENIGAIVEVLEPWVDDGRGLSGSTQWACRAAGRPLRGMQWAQFDDGPPIRVGYKISKPGDKLVCPDADLRPITGLPDADDTQRELDKPREAQGA